MKFAYRQVFACVTVTRSLPHRTQLLTAPLSPLYPSSPGTVPTNFQIACEKGAAQEKEREIVYYPTDTIFTCAILQVADGRCFQKQNMLTGQDCAYQSRFTLFEIGSVIVNRVHSCRLANPVFALANTAPPPPPSPPQKKKKKRKIENVTLYNSQKNHYKTDKGNCLWPQLF